MTDYVEDRHASEEISLRDYIERLFHEQEKAVQRVAESQERAVQQLAATQERATGALAANSLREAEIHADAHRREHAQAQTAIDKSENQNVAWRAEANEWRGTLNDALNRFATRDDLATLNKDMDGIQLAISRLPTRVELETNKQNIESLQLWRSNMEGRLIVLAAVGPLITLVLLMLDWVFKGVR